MIISPLQIIKRYKNIKRVKEIVSTFAKYGFGYVLAKSKLDKFVVGKVISEKAVISASIGENLRRAIEDLGPTFIKFAQLLSVRKDLLPEDIIREFAKLQDSVEPFDTNIAIKIIEEELRQPLNNIFSEFSSEPVGSASLSQVHKAKLLPHNTPVVVKVQRPNIKSTIESDLEIIELLVQVVGKKFEIIEQLNIRDLLKEFRKSIFRELNFRREMYNMIRFREYFSNDNTVKIPRVYENLCTDKVLVMEDVGGIKIDAVDLLKEKGYNVDVIARNFINCVARQIFELGVVHVDPHPGNIVVLPQNVVCFLDFGMVKMLDTETRNFLFTIAFGAVSKDASRICKALRKYIKNDKGEKLLLDSLLQQLHELITFYYELPISDVDIETVIGEILDIISSYRIVLPPSIFFISRALSFTESIVKTLTPNLHTAKEIMPFVTRFVDKYYGIGGIVDEFKKFVIDAAQAAKNIPENVDTLLTLLNEGRLEIEFKHKGLDKIVIHLDRIVKRLALSIISGTLFIGSAIILRYSSDIVVYRLISIVGLVLAGGFILLLILSFFKR
jgi:ubiquinone biosynthesis protein